MSGSWLFADYYEGTYLRQQQLLQTAALRLFVLLFARSVRRVERNIGLWIKQRKVIHRGHR